jgi:ribosome-associated toxin RatA of RatAB toxin-antitoxin module
MHTENTVLIRGSRDRIFELAANIQDWPRLLPHYRYVILEERSERHRVARMGASRDGFPVKWRARQELFPEEYRIVFQHIGGITKGMGVEWRLEPEGDAVRVTISHDLSYPIPVLGPLFAEYIIGRMFVHNIAGKTLRCIQEKVEAEARAEAERAQASAAGSSSPASEPSPP